MQALSGKLFLSGMDENAASLARKWGLGLELTDFCEARKLEEPAAMEAARGLQLPQDAVMAVLELCSALGRYDLDGENRMLDLTAKRLQAALDRCEAEKRPRAKCYAALGFCTGLALLILAV